MTTLLCVQQINPLDKECMTIELNAAQRLKANQQIAPESDVEADYSTNVGAPDLVNPYLAIAVPRDGKYDGTISGYQCEFEAPTTKTGHTTSFVATTLVGLRGRNIPATVVVVDGFPKVSLKPMSKGRQHHDY